MGELEGSGGRAVGRSNPTSGEQLSDQRHPDAARVRARARAHQVGRGRREPRASSCCRPAIAKAIQGAALEIAGGKHREQFPIDVFQTGSGTSSNMNANEVIAKLATKALGKPVHANDHVNMSQSSNDVIPSAIHVSAALEITQKLLPALEHLQKTIDKKAKKVEGIVKTGRTHLMDAMPVRLDQELGGWSAQILSNIFRLKGALPRLTGLAQGGTAVGTGINAHPEFGAKFAAVAREEDGRRLPSARQLLRGDELAGHGGRGVRACSRPRP